MTEKLLKEIADHYGTKHQLLKLAEEAAELSAAAVRLAQYQGDDERCEEQEDFEWELADVLVMITQMVYLMNIDEPVAKKVDVKVARQIERMKMTNRE